MSTVQRLLACWLTQQAIETNVTNVTDVTNVTNGGHEELLERVFGRVVGGVA